MNHNISSEPITLSESKRLLALEQTVARGQQTFVEVGIALAEIRDSKLYRSDCATFEDYCRTKWNFTRQYVNQLIAGTAAVKSLPADLETIVSNVGQARALAMVEPEKRVEVIRKASAQAKSKSRPITAKDIQIAAAPARPTEPDLRRRFPTATTTSKRAESWWYRTAKPEKRGEFFWMLLTSTGKPVSVADKEKFKKQIMHWLENDVHQKSV